MSGKRRQAKSKPSYFRGKATVHGRVTAERTGKPVAEAEVTVSLEGFDRAIGWSSRAGHELKATTDAKGHYTVTIPGLKKFDEDAFTPCFTVVVSAPGFVPDYIMRANCTTRVPYTGKRLTVSFRLKPAFAMGGRVLDEKGKPIEGVEVLVYQTSSYGCSNPSLVGGGWPMTDADGRFLADGMPMGLPSEQRQVAGFFHADYVRRFVQRIGDLPRGRGRMAELGDVVLRKGLSLSGTVRTPRGKPVSGATVLVMAQEPYQGDPGCARPPAKWDITTDADGRYCATGLPPMVYHVIVNHDSHPPGARMDVKVMTRSRSGVDVVLDKKAGVLAGTVTNADGTPAANYAIQADQYNAPEPQATTTNKQGRYKLSGFAPNIAVTFEGPDDMDPLAWFDPPNEHADIRLPEELAVTGRLVDALTGEPIRREKEFLISTRPYWGRGIRDRSTARSGTFEICGVHPGRTYVCATAEDYAVTCREMALKASCCDLGDFPLYRTVTLTGQVLTSSGKPIRNAEVFIDGPHYYDGTSTRTSANGRYTFKDLRHVPYQFRVRAEGFAPFYQQIIEPPADGRRFVKDVRMTKGVSIRGRVMDGSVPVGKQIVVLSTRRIRGRNVKRPWIADTNTTNTGEFLFPNIRPGKYELRCGLEQRNITVKASAPLTCNFRWPGRLKLPPHESKGGYAL